MGRGFQQVSERIEGYARFQGHLTDGPETMLECLQFDCEMDRLAERLGTYAFLRTAEDQANDHYQGLVARYQNVAVRAGQIASFLRPEILAISDDQMADYLASDVLQDFRLVLQRITRYRPHTLSESEEALLAMQGEMAQTASKAFRQLNDADLRFGELKNEQGQSVELTNATYSQFMISPARDVRKAAFHQYYDQFAAHENTLAATLAGSIHTDVYYAKARRYDSSLHAALFPDQRAPGSVYDSLDLQPFAITSLPFIATLSFGGVKHGVGRDPSLRYLCADPERSRPEKKLGRSGRNRVGIAGAPRQ